MNSAGEPTSSILLKETIAFHFIVPFIVWSNLRQRFVDFRSVSSKSMLLFEGKAHAKCFKCWGRKHIVFNSYKTHPQCK